MPRGAPGATSSKERGEEAAAQCCCSTYGASWRRTGKGWQVSLLGIDRFPSGWQNFRSMPEGRWQGAPCYAWEQEGAR